jgi:hypothetical protein
MTEKIVFFNLYFLYYEPEVCEYLNLRDNCLTLIINRTSNSFDILQQWINNDTIYIETYKFDPID